MRSDDAGSVAATQPGPGRTRACETTDRRRLDYVDEAIIRVDGTGCGCAFAQGYLFDRPLVPDAIRVRLQRRRRGDVPPDLAC